jgi:5'-nucleotidase
MKRRDFVRKSLLVTGSLALAPKIIGRELVKAKPKLTILHTNDTHSNVEPFPLNHAKFPGMGGVSKRYALIEQIRSEEEHVLLLDAGDIFQGTPYFNKYGGELEMKLMSYLKYDAATMGNHDFDAGLDGFLKAHQHANFPFLCANYDFTNTVLNDITQSNVIFDKGQIKVGVFGIGVELKGLVPDEKFGNTVYLDPIETANQQAEMLKKEGCDLVICLSHLGFEHAEGIVSDRVLATSTKGIHIILGGHTHTFLEDPAIEINLDGEDVIINQVGWGGVKLGRLDIEWDGKMSARKTNIEIK